MVGHLKLHHLFLGDQSLQNDSNTCWQPSNCKRTNCNSECDNKTKANHDHFSVLFDGCIVLARTNQTKKSFSPASKPHNARKQCTNCHPNVQGSPKTFVDLDTTGSVGHADMWITCKFCVSRDSWLSCSIAQGVGFKVKEMIVFRTWENDIHWCCGFRLLENGCTLSFSDKFGWTNWRESRCSFKCAMCPGFNVLFNPPKSQTPPCSVVLLWNDKGSDNSFRSSSFFQDAQLHWGVQFWLECILAMCHCVGHGSAWQWGPNAFSHFGKHQGGKTLDVSWMLPANNFVCDVIFEIFFNQITDGRLWQLLPTPVVALVLPVAS